MARALPPSFFRLQAENVPEYPPLDVSRRADVCIVGGGFTGLSAALHLAADGADVVLVEANSVASGASGRNGGQIHSGLRRDVIWLEQPNDAALFAEIGDTLWRGDKPLRTGLVIVTEVNGTAISLDRGLPFDFDAGMATVEVTHMVRDVTVKGITLRGDYGMSDEANFANTVASENGGMMMVVNGTIVVRGGRLAPGVWPGRAVRGPVE